MCMSALASLFGNASYGGWELASRGRTGEGKP